ncbi:solute carrier family 25 protein [archaeon]|nr:MAG: solute carrier family 25 protein [archaeon]
MSSWTTVARALAPTCAPRLQPTDLVKVRFQSEGRLPPGQAPRYSGVMNAYATIVRQEGFLGLWTGLMPAVARNSVINATELASYETAKEVSGLTGRVCIGKRLCDAYTGSPAQTPLQQRKKHVHARAAARTRALYGRVHERVVQVFVSRFGFQDNLGTHFMSGAVAGLMATLVGNPVDVVKTRVMAARKTSAVGAVSYNGAIDCIVKTLKNEGPFAFYQGVVPQFFRITCWNIVMFITYEQLKKLASTQLKLVKDTV